MQEIPEAEIRTRLRAEADFLQGSRDRLAGLRDAIPASAEETSEEDLHGALDLATEIRTVLAIQLREGLEPLLERLRAAAEYQPSAPAPATTVVPAPVLLDLTASEETLRPVVYALVARDNFTARGSDEEPREIWLPPYTPEEAGLRVWKKHGRWFATWRKLEVPETAPEDERWEVLLIDEDPRRRGSLVYREIQPG
ncbi:MAG TPA: hypothetical protein VMM92_02375 [Thermoanaerobaculia bacterium]|nr:hypothetical protein [Thermoanaerobaculia bacterium]